nr:PQ-loop domain-containing transporter [Gammaproteobacteria bacterium]
MAIDEIAGWLAAIFTTLILVPQVIKAIATKKTRDVSMLMIVFTVLGNLGWLVLAIYTANRPLMVCASLIIILSFIMIIFKFNNDRSQ